jgi:hypothetical protein
MSWWPVIAFGAPQVEPRVIGNCFDIFLQHHVMGFESAESAIRKALATTQLAQHTDIHLFSPGLVCVFRWTPLSRHPDGPVICCNSPMKPDEFYYRADGAVRVIFKCRHKGHSDPKKRRRVVLYPGSIPGKTRVIGKGESRITIEFATPTR